MKVQKLICTVLIALNVIAQDSTFKNIAQHTQKGLEHPISSQSYAILGAFNMKNIKEKSERHIEKNSLISGKNFNENLKQAPPEIKKLIAHELKILIEKSIIFTNKPINCQNNNSSKAIATKSKNELEYYKGFMDFCKSRKYTNEIINELLVEYNFGKIYLKYHSYDLEYYKGFKDFVESKKNYRDFSWKTSSYDDKSLIIQKLLRDYQKKSFESKFLSTYGREPILQPNQQKNHLVFFDQSQRLSSSLASASRSKSEYSFNHSPLKQQPTTQQIPHPITQEEAIFLLEEPYALELIQEAKEFLEPSSSMSFFKSSRNMAPFDLEKGEQIITALHDQSIITNKYKLIWATTDKKSGYNLFKDVHNNVKKLIKEQEKVD